MGEVHSNQLKDCIATKWNSNLAVEWKKGGKDEWGTLVPCRNISRKGIFVPGKVAVAREAAVSDFIKFSTVNNEDHVTGGRKHVLNVNFKK